MKSQNAQNLIDKIDLAIQEISSLRGISPAEESYLAKFLVVFICGIYEETIEAIINEMVGKLRNPEVSNFIEKSLKYTFRNPDTDNICTLLSRFNNMWKEEIKKMSLQSRTALNSIKSNKDSVAHGSLSTITLGDVINYYRDSRPLIEKIDDLIL